MKVQKKFVRYISHELRTPLNAVRMGLQFLIAELPKFIQNHELMDSLETTELASLSAINILNDLLTFDKIEEGNLTLDRQMASARDLISSATAIFHAQVCLVDTCRHMSTLADILYNGICSCLIFILQ